MAGERAYQRALKLKTEMWLLAEARYEASEVQPDWRTVLGHPEVSYTVAELLFVIELFWYDPALPEQVRDAAMKTAARITNYKPPVAGVYRR